MPYDESSSAADKRYAFRLEIRQTGHHYATKRTLEREKSTRGFSMIDSRSVMAAASGEDCYIQLYRGDRNNFAAVDLDQNVLYSFRVCSVLSDGSRSLWYYSDARTKIRNLMVVTSAAGFIVRALQKMRLKSAKVCEIWTLPTCIRVRKSS